MVSPLEYQFNYALDKYGHDAVVNNEQQIKVLLKEYNEGTNITEYKYMLVKNGFVSQGDIIALRDDNWIVMHENITINNVYTKVLIRRIRHNINFNFTGEVISIPSAIDEGTMGLDEDIIITPEGKIILYVQENETTKRIEKEQRFLIMGNAWKVIQKINPEHGIYKIYCEIDLFNNDDDRENEIADRWKYEEKPKNIASISTLDNITVAVGTDITAIDLPTTVTITLDDNTTTELNIIWDTTNYNKDIAGTYNLTGNLELTEGITNTNNLVANINITVEEMQEITYSIEGSDSIYWGYTETYIARKYENGEEVDTNFTFELVPIDGDFATIENTTNNTVEIKADSGVYGYMKLIATDIGNGETVEKEILIKGLI